MNTKAKLLDLRDDFMNEKDVVDRINWIIEGLDDYDKKLFDAEKRIENLELCISDAASLLCRIDKYQLINSFNDEDQDMIDHYSFLCAGMVKEFRSIMGINKT